MLRLQWLWLPSLIRFSEVTLPLLRSSQPLPNLRSVPVSAMRRRPAAATEHVMRQPMPASVKLVTFRQTVIIAGP